MGEYNELTKQLLAEGYTAKHYPSYVRVATGCYDRSDPLKNIYGGFEYQRIYADKFVYQTGCGLFCQGKNVLDVGTGGENHCHENNNPVVSCPFRKTECLQNYSKYLGSSGGGLAYQCWCEVHRTDAEYDHSHSIELEREKNEQKRKALYAEMSKKYNGRICQNHMFFDERLQQWSFLYNPKRCQNYCPHQYAYCDVLGKKLSKKKGNVFYDIKKDFDVIVQDGEQIGLFDKSHMTEIVKGLKVFKNPVPIDICEAYAKMGAKEILEYYKLNNSREYFWNKSLQISILNVRAEVKETRDLLQDLEDIKNGITISHESDNIESKKSEKRERAAKAKDAKRRKFLKQIEQIGWFAMDDIDRKNARKVLEQEEIEDADEKYLASLNQPKEQNKQLSIFDLMGGD